MNVDGYALLEINLKGESKYHSGDFIDIRLQRANFDTDHIKEDLLAQLPQGISDVLVMCLFRYRSESSYDWCSGATEYEDCFDLVSHSVIQNNYKEFYRTQLTEELNTRINGVDNINSMPNGDNYYQNTIGEWEEFYEEKFESFTKKPTQIKKIDSLFNS